MPKYDGFFIRFYADSGYDNYGVLSALPHAPGWNTVEFSESGISYYGQMTNMSIVQRFEFYASIPAGVQDSEGNYTNGSNNPWSVTFDLLEAWPEYSTKGAVIFAFDDGYLSSYEKGIRYLHANGFCSMMYVSGERMGTGSGEDTFCTWDDIAAAASAGCFICCHAQTATPTTTKDDVRAFCEKQKNYLVERGYIVGADYWAIPGGQRLWAVSGAVLTPQEQYEVALEYFVHVRGTAPYWEDINDADADGRRPQGNNAPFSRTPRDVHWGTLYYTGGGLAAVETMVDKTVANKGVLTLTTHRIGPTGISETDFRAIVDHVKRHVNNGELEVITYEDIVMGR